MRQVIAEGRPVICYVHPREIEPDHPQLSMGLRRRFKSYVNLDTTEKNSGIRYAVKKFEKRSGPGEKSKVDGLQQEIAVLMGVSHPNMLCLKDTFDEADGVYLVLELAPEGELFNHIVLKQKLSEDETRHLFIQLFQGIKYLVG